jgi:hypothetical protein
MNTKSKARLQFAVCSARCGRPAVIIVPDDAMKKALLQYARDTYGDFDKIDVKVDSLSGVISGNSGAVLFIDEFGDEQ